MASRPKRRFSKELPPDLSELMNKLLKAAASFIQVFDKSEDRMRQIAAEIDKLADDVKQMQMTKNNYRTIGGAVLLLGAVAAPFTGGMSLVAATAGGATVIYTNVRKMLEENQSSKKVKDLGTEFMDIVEPMKNELEEIKVTCEKLEEKSAEVQAENSLSDVEEFQRILTRVIELGKKSKEAVDVSVATLTIIHDLMVLMINVFRVTANSEEDQKLTHAIIQSADQSLKTINELEKMKAELSKFKEGQGTDSEGLSGTLG